MKFDLIFLCVLCVIFGVFLNSFIATNKKHDDLFEMLKFKIDKGEFKIVDKVNDLVGDGSVGEGEGEGEEDDEELLLLNSELEFSLEDLKLRSGILPKVRDLNEKELNDMKYLEKVSILDVFKEMDKIRTNETCLAMHMFVGYPGEALNVISIWKGVEVGVTQPPPIHAINLKISNRIDDTNIFIRVESGRGGGGKRGKGVRMKVKKNVIINYINADTEEEVVDMLSHKTAIEVQIAYLEMIGKDPLM